MDGRKPASWRGMYADLADAVAVLSFLPGGITIFGQTYETKLGH